VCAARDRNLTTIGGGVLVDRPEVVDMHAFDKQVE
jgi:hypothetical protein